MSNPDDSSLEDADLRLLESGNFADATIVCGDRTWKVHKLILSSRSKWFSTAFHNENFAEAASGKIVLEEQDPDLVDALIRFIYEKYIHIPSVKDGRDVPALCIRIFRLGDFFLLDDLKEASTDQLDKYISSISECINTETDDGEAPKWLLEILNALKEAYKDRSTEAVLKTLIEFVSLNTYNVFKFQDAVSLLDEIPEMAKDLVKTQANSDIAAKLRGPRLRVGIPVAAAVERSRYIYQPTETRPVPAAARIPCLLYPIIDNSDSVFRVVNAGTEKEIERLDWITPVASDIAEITSNPDSAIVRVRSTSWYNGGKMLYIRFNDPRDATFYSDRYFRANHGIEKSEEDSASLAEDMRMGMNRVRCQYKSSTRATG